MCMGNTFDKKNNTSLIVVDVIEHNTNRAGNFRGGKIFVRLSNSYFLVAACTTGKGSQSRFICVKIFAQPNVSYMIPCPSSQPRYLYTWNEIT